MPPQAERFEPERFDPVAFATALRRAGLAVPVSATIAWTDALGVVGVDRPASMYWAGRATLVRRPEDRPAYDRCFASFFLGASGADDEPAFTPEAVVGFDDEVLPPDPVHSGSPARPDTTVRWSRSEVLRRRDLAKCSPEELDEVWAMLAWLRVGGSTRRSRRMVRTHRRSASLDLRRTARAAVRTDGEPLTRHHRGPGERRRRIVLLIDVSGSMESYARALLRFANAALIGRRQVEVFTIGTRLTRVTRELASHDPDVAPHRVSTAVDDLTGGTLGETIGTFNERWGARGMARGADVVILSDGWDRGAPEELEVAMERLHRLAHRVIWVNPLKASPGYAPLARGMAAALPNIDVFVEGHSLASLEELADVLAG